MSAAAQAENHAIEEEEVVEFKSIEELQSEQRLPCAYPAHPPAARPLTALLPPSPPHRRGHQRV